VKQEFRAGLGLIRVAESVLTAIAYYHLGLFAAETQNMIWMILPSVLLGIPLGAWAIRRLDAETFRRICMSFDVWVVGFGLSRVLIDLKLAHGALAYGPMALAIVLDIYLLYVFFSNRSEAKSSLARA
jgi:mannitol-specific phosphotransferase system IIBC component